MASQQNRPVVDEGPIPFFSNVNDKDPFGAIQPPPPQRQAVLAQQQQPQRPQQHQQQQSTPVGDASSLFGQPSSQSSSTFAQQPAGYQPAQPVQASPFQGQGYGSTGSFFDQPNSSYYGSPAQRPNQPPQQQSFGYGQQHQPQPHQGDQQVPHYANQPQQQYAGYGQQQVPASNQPYYQQQQPYQFYGSPNPAAQQAHGSTASHSYGAQYQPATSYSPSPSPQHHQQSHFNRDPFSPHNYTGQQQPQQQHQHQQQHQQYKGYQQQPEQQSGHAGPYAPIGYAPPQQQQQQQYAANAEVEQQQPLYEPTKQPAVRQEQPQQPQQQQLPQQQRQQQQQQQSDPYGSQSHASYDQQQQYDPSTYFDQGQQQYDTLAYSEQQQHYDPNQQQLQFDPNVHYYYDEAGQVHYYDPNTNQDYEFSQYGYDQAQPEEVPPETAPVSLDHAHADQLAKQRAQDMTDPFAQVHGGYETDDPFAQSHATQDLQLAGQDTPSLQHNEEVPEPTPQPASVPVKHEEPPITAGPPKNFGPPKGFGPPKDVAPREEVAPAEPIQTHDFSNPPYDQQEYGLDVKDTFVPESSADTTDLDDLVLGGHDQSTKTAPAPPTIPAFASNAANGQIPADSAAPTTSFEHSSDFFTQDQGSFGAYNPEEGTFHGSAGPQHPTIEETIAEPSNVIDELTQPQDVKSSFEPASFTVAEHDVPEQPSAPADSFNKAPSVDLTAPADLSMSAYSPYQPPPQSVQSCLSPPQSVFSVSTTLFPCPDSECQGENPPKAKFCCECGRQLAALSRAATPAAHGVRSFSGDSGSFLPHGVPPQAHVPSVPSHHLGRTASSLAPASAAQDQYTPQSYYGAEAYDPYQQQQYGGNENQYQQQPEKAYDQQYNQQFDQQNDYGQQYSTYGQVETEAQVEPAIDDPLGRGQGCPIAVFGFGGKLCLMFPHKVQRYNGGYASANDQFASVVKTMPGDVIIKNIKSTLTETNPAALVPLTDSVGPLLMDHKISAKAKKKDALKYVNARVDALKAQLDSLYDDARAKRKVETKVLLWRIIGAVLEADGPIGENSKLDQQIRDIIYSADVNVKDDNFASFTVPADGQQAITTTNTDDNYSNDIIEILQTHLLRGDREAAVKYAVQEDLWAHALIISSCVNKDLWMEVVHGFGERELSNPAPGAMQTTKVVHGDRQGLRVLYALFAGQGAKATQEFVLSSQQGFNRLGGTAAPFNPAQPPSYDDTQLAHWQDTLALILANRTPRDFEAITALGDILIDNDFNEAAQICYLVSPQSSIHAGIDTPNVKLTLIGASPSNKSGMWHDIEAIHLTELWEFAVSSKQPAGSQGLPFLQGYKLVLAWILADYGYITEAQRYCEAMAGILKAYTKGSPYLHKHLLEKLKELNELCEMSGHGAGADSATSWLKQKIPKPTLDSIWGSLEGKFNKFVSGEDLPTEEPEARKSTEIIASSVPEPSLPARSASAVDMRYNAGRQSADWARRAATPQSGRYGPNRSVSPGTGLGGVQGLTAYNPEQDLTEQPAGSLHSSRVATPNPPENAYSYGQPPSKGVFSPFGQIQADTVDEVQTETYQSYQPYGEEDGGAGYWSGGANDMPDAVADEDQYNPPSNGYQSSQYESPQYSLYESPDHEASQYEPSAQQQQQQQPQQPQPPSYEPAPASNNYMEDDLGLGNKGNKAENVQTQEPNAVLDNTVPATESKEEKGAGADKQIEKQASGWGLFSIFSRSNTATPEKKAVRANLGEESSFYYDAEQKRWVNKKGGADSGAATPTPPPPPRSANTTPAALQPPPSSTPPVGAPPPTGPPPGGNLPRATSAPAQGPLPPPAGASMPAQTFTTPPPPSGAGAGAGAARKAAGGRKPMRSRYVDVFNQPQE